MRFCFFGKHFLNNLWTRWATIHCINTGVGQELSSSCSWYFQIFFSLISASAVPLRQTVFCNFKIVTWCFHIWMNETKRLMSAPAATETTDEQTLKWVQTCDTFWKTFNIYMIYNKYMKDIKDLLCESRQICDAVLTSALFFSLFFLLRHILFSRCRSKTKHFTWTNRINMFC